MNREEFIQQIKDCGQSIIDNAENLYNSFEYPTNGVDIQICVTKDATPCITVVKAFIPEQFVIGLRDNPKRIW